MAKARRALRKDVADALRYGTAPLHGWRIVTRILSRFGTTHVLLLYRKDLTLPLDPVRADLPLEITLASVDEIGDVAALNVEKPGLEAEYRKRLRRGHRCFLARHRGELVGYNWTFVKPKRVAGRLIRPRPGEVYTDDAYTVRACRGKGVHTELNYAMLRDAKERGFKGAYAIAALANTIAWVALKRLGWRYLGAVLYFKAKGARTPRSWRVSGTVTPLADVYGAFRRRRRVRLVPEALRAPVTERAGRFPPAAPG